jgi:catechol 2,3-dioxygenase-like lactoylglutathione lyase family enzyme
MQRAIKGIDHVMIVVPDLDEAAKAYARLGFDVQPRGIHKGLGTANHLMILNEDYIELLGVLEPMPNNLRYKEIGEQGGALANVALGTDGADLAHAAWTKAGLNPEPIIAFDRGVDIAGKQERAAFRIVRLPHEARPGVGLFVCNHLTPQFVYRPEWQRHANTATGISHITIVAAEPTRHRVAAEKVFGADAITSGDGEMVVATGKAPFRYLTPERFAERYPNQQPALPGDHAAVMGIKVRDMAALKDCVTRNNVHAEETRDKRVLIPAEAACNVLIEFSA